MNKFLVSILLFVASSCFAQKTPALIPQPNAVEMVFGKSFVLSNQTKIVADDGLEDEAEYLIARILQRWGIQAAVTCSSKADGLIRLKMDQSLKDNPEHYSLLISQYGISINGASAEAVFDGIQTLDQWMIDNALQEGSSVKIEPIKIDDSPRYGYRALMLDPARHFIPAEDVKRYIDEMVRYKFNVLQMHLADDQGWRVEIKSHPELADKEQSYTQAELRDLINYAAKRHVEIVPELDIPGHTYSLLMVHPEYLCEGVDTTNWGKELKTDVMLCASNDAIYPLMSDVLKEVCELFPSKYIHLGGDESRIEKNWGKCARCQALKFKLGYQGNDQLMGYFFSHFWKQLRSAGKKPILWIEMDNIYPPATRYLFDYPKDVTLVTWRNGLTPKAIELTAEHGNNLIMAPGEHCYFDYPQYKNDFPEFNNWGMPLLPLDEAYKWNPSYPEVPTSKEQIQGVMGTLWGEAIMDVNRAFYMTYPRAMALAENGWTQETCKSWDSFKSRLKPVLGDLLGRGVSFRVPYEIYK